MQRAITCTNISHKDSLCTVPNISHILVAINVPKSSCFAVLQSEGSVWRAVSLLAAAGQLRTALLTLRASGLADAALGFSAICREAGFGANPKSNPSESIQASSDAATDTGDLDDLYPHGSTGLRRAERPLSATSGDVASSGIDAVTESNHAQYVVRLLQAL